MPHLLYFRSLIKEGGLSSVYTMYTRAHYSSRGNDWLQNTTAPSVGVFPLISTQLAFLTPLACAADIALHSWQVAKGTYNHCCSVGDYICIAYIFFCCPPSRFDREHFVYRSLNFQIIPQLLQLNSHSFYTLSQIALYNIRSQIYSSHMQRICM